MRGDESIVATFQIDRDMMQPLVDQACAALGVPTVASLVVAGPAETASIEVCLEEALQDNQLAALNAVGWETNER